ncbi:MAG: hypothetical protein M0C28_18690 [Candidatus Moduliflexus flocculans]|nr:hypothetical protein [Candidatus Moduliflexus flocculans]
MTRTTRPKRVNEIDGFDHQFVDEAELDRLVETKYVSPKRRPATGFATAPRARPASRRQAHHPRAPRALESFTQVARLHDRRHLSADERIGPLRERMRYRQRTPAEEAERRHASDRERFDPTHIAHVDMVIDTTNMSASDIADMIYGNYKFLLGKKQNPSRTDAVVSGRRSAFEALTSKSVSFCTFV